MAKMGDDGEEKLGAHAQEHHVAVDKLLFIPSREEVRQLVQTAIFPSFMKS